MTQPLSPQTAILADLAQVNSLPELRDAVEIQTRDSHAGRLDAEFVVDL